MSDYTVKFMETFFMKSKTLMFLLRKSLRKVKKRKRKTMRLKISASVMNSQNCN